ncbi:MAG: TetR/AcrR family transcriptional regulator [Cyclobacteriaceae bacterium]|nr:TetR/AcrR family transcriptional regulator [Cyclobacteriaceae bacterium]
MSGLREQKSALIRVNLAKNLESRLRNERFDAIKVTDLCKSINISKVTFFKYFSSKEELLRYYFRIWCLELCYELYKKPKKGEDGIYFIFERVVSGLNNIPNFFYAYYSYQVNDKRIRSPFPIKEKERKIIIGEDSAEIEIRSLKQLIENFVLEAIFSNEIEVSDPKTFSDFLYTHLIGFVVLNGVNNSVPNYMEVRNNLEHIILKYK